MREIKCRMLGERWASARRYHDLKRMSDLRRQASVGARILGGVRSMLALSHRWADAHRSPSTFGLSKFIILAVVFATTFTANAKEPAAALKAGAAKSEITLPVGATNGGVIARGGPATAIHDQLFARAVVLDDGRIRLAIVVCDLRMIGRPVVQRAKSLATAATGIDGDHIIISATHTHAAPAVIGMHAGEDDRAYAEMVAAGVADAVRGALKNLAPAQIGWGLGAAPQHVFNRRWFMKEGKIGPNPFGETGDRVKMNPPAGGDLVKPAGPVDPQVSVISIKHADGRPLALLANYGLHYVGGYERGQVSADYFGVFARRVEKLLGAAEQDPPFVGMMSNGTSGDVNNINFREKRERLPAWKKMEVVAEDLADEAARVEREIKYLRRVELAVAVNELSLAVRRPNEQRLAWARRTLAAAKNPDRPTRVEVYAQEALHLAEFPERVPVKLAAFRIGELRIAAIPCEVFAETGLAIKKHNAPHPAFTIELANGYNGYLPTPQQHQWGGYETWPARSAYLEVEAESKIRRAMIELLKTVGSEAR